MVLEKIFWGLWGLENYFPFNRCFNIFFLLMQMYVQRDKPAHKKKDLVRIMESFHFEKTSKVTESSC